MGLSPSVLLYLLLEVEHLPAYKELHDLYSRQLDP